MKSLGKSCHSREFLASHICLVTLIAKIKFTRKCPNLQYLCRKNSGYVNIAFSSQKGYHR